MRIHCLQHVAFEGPAAIADWSHARGHELVVTRLDLGEPLPSSEAFDWLVVMGGPMGVADTGHYHWMRPEIELIQAAVRSGKRILGVCLGAQLLAHALGARVDRAPHREIGWFEVVGLPINGEGGCPVLPESFTALHWHGDTFEIPAGAVRLAQSPACANQAFQYGRRALGLQFHLESTPESVAELVKHCGHESADGPWEAPLADIVNCEAQCAATRPILEHVLLFLECANE